MPHNMSNETEPVIHTVGSVDRPEKTNLHDEIPRSTANVPPTVPDSKLGDTEHRKKESRGNTITVEGVHIDATSPQNSGGPGVVGEIRTVGSADPAGGDAGASSVMHEETKHGQK